jgi:hypothetical protein
MPRNVFEVIDRLSSDLDELRRALAPLGALAPSSSVSSKPLRTAAPAVAAAPKAKKARKRISPKVKAMRVLQARYMNLVRGLSQIQRAQVKKAKADGGYEPALKLAASFKK